MADYFWNVALRWYSVVIDCKDIVAQSRWWGEVLGWQVEYEAPDEVVLVPADGSDPSKPAVAHLVGPGLVFVPVPEGKSLKNRLHIDLAPPAGADQEAEVRRLEELGAKQVDLGQDPTKTTWVVLEDPEGNEFCVLSPRD
jgi:Glyoxalase-like domain